MASAILILYGELLDNIVQMFERLVTKMDSGIEKRWQEYSTKRFAQNKLNRAIIVQAAETFAQPVEKMVDLHSKFDLEALRRALADCSARGDQDEIDKAIIS